jgi:hypothetical protein
MPAVIIFLLRCPGSRRSLLWLLYLILRPGVTGKVYLFELRLYSNAQMPPNGSTNDADLFFQIGMKMGGNF